MVARLKRKDMKQDEFVDASMRAVQRLESNPRPVIYGAIAVLVVIFGAVVIWQVAAGMEARSAEQVARGQAAVMARVGGEEPAAPDDAYQPRFETIEARGRGAAERLDGASGELAEYLRGAALLDAGETERAVAELEQAAAAYAGDPTLAGPVKAALAGAYGRADRTEESIELWRELATSETVEFPRDVALASLARELEATGETGEALDAWREIVDLYPNSPLRRDAEQAVGRLTDGSV
jgi:tetratricopeptide (TPR) repeat protein